MAAMAIQPSHQDRRTYVEHLRLGGRLVSLRDLMDKPRSPWAELVDVP
jgi:hypothetical protein